MSWIFWFLGTWLVFAAGILVGMTGYRRMAARSGYVIVHNSTLARYRALHCEKENEYDG